MLFVAPFSDLVSFHEEYKIHCAENSLMPEEVGSPTVFSEAFHHLYKNAGYRLQSSKGVFNTCEICNNAKELLRNKSIYNIIHLFYFLFKYY